MKKAHGLGWQRCILAASAKPTLPASRAAATNDELFTTI
jgi:hypothetical protein